MSDIDRAREVFKRALQYRRDYETEYPYPAAEKYIAALEAENAELRRERDEQAEQLAGAGLCPARGIPPLVDMALCDDNDGDCCLNCWTQYLAAPSPDATKSQVRRIALQSEPDAEEES